MKFHKHLLVAVISVCSALGQNGIKGVIAPDAKVELVKEGFTFLEGPLGTADGGLYFSDLMGSNKTYRLEPNGNISVYRSNTNGTNGLAFNRSGELIGVEGDGKRISKAKPDGTVTAVTTGIAGMGLMAPNDLIGDPKGGIYFTDPGPRPLVAGRKAYVYYLPDGLSQPRILDDTITRPNGLTLTNDGKKLIVDDTVGDTVFIFDVQSDGGVSNKRPFAKVQGVKPGTESGADGMAIDSKDRLYVTSASGVQVFDKKGAYLGTIAVARQPSNVVFSGPGKKILYITAREGLYKVPVLTAGPRRNGK